MISRRRFLELGSFASASFLAPGFLKCFSNGNDITNSKKLIILQLSGGNDGLNTVVPVRNDIYFKSRPTISLKKTELLQITDDTGLPVTLKGLKSLYDEGHVAIINSVGYPYQNRSHVQSMNIWHSAHTDHHIKTGWVGRYLDTIAGNTKAVYEIDKTTSLISKGKYREGVAINNKASAVRNYYPDTEIGRKMQFAAQLARQEDATKVIYLSHGSFDTHVHQKAHHAHLLKELDESLMALVNDLKQHDRFKDTLILTFSEFGRSVHENKFGGTDHGAANNMFVIGGSLTQAGLYNRIPDLSMLDDGALNYEIDFRQVYATVLQHWLGANAKSILRDSYRPLSFV